MKDLILKYKYENRIHSEIEFNNVRYHGRDNLVLPRCKEDVHLICDKINYKFDFEYLLRKNKDKIKEITIMEDEYLPSDFLNYFPNLEIINFSNKENPVTNILYLNKNVKEINYQNINILDYCDVTKALGIDSVLLRTCLALKVILNVPTELKEKIMKDLNVKKPAILNIEKYFKYKECKDFFDKIYTPAIGCKMIHFWSADILNSPEFFDFIERKQINNHLDFKYSYLSDISNYKLLFKLLNNDYKYIFENLNNYHDEIKFNKKVINILLENLDYGCFSNISNFSDTISYFKDDYDMIGRLSKLFVDYTMKHENVNDFLTYINYAPLTDDNLEKLYWLCANNMSFYSMLTEKEQKDYILFACSSFDSCQTTNPYEYKKYSLNSQFYNIDVSFKDFLKIEFTQKTKTDQIFYQHTIIYGKSDNDFIEKVKNTIEQTKTELLSNNEIEK